jgi:hypothetical protein
VDSHELFGIFIFSTVSSINFELARSKSSAALAIGLIEAVCFDFESLVEGLDTGTNICDWPEKIGSSGVNSILVLFAIFILLLVIAEISISKASVSVLD